MHDQPVRPKERFLVFGSPLIEEAEIVGVIAAVKRLLGKS